jgi:hypothetical protein
MSGEGWVVLSLPFAPAGFVLHPWDETLRSLETPNSMETRVTREQASYRIVRADEKTASRGRSRGFGGPQGTEESPLAEPLNDASYRRVEIEIARSRESS